ncbi:MAG: YkvA family protein [Candidatus Xenobiia bacterium LiM19]
MKVADSLREKAQALKRELLALSLAARHPETPWLAKFLVLIVMAYALSPIDLIPDFIPVIGLLDDLVLLPLGIALAIRMIPRRVMEECREKALLQDPLKKNNIFAALSIILIWLALSVMAVLLLSKLFTLPRS